MRKKERKKERKKDIFYSESIEKAEINSQE